MAKTDNGFVTPIEFVEANGKKINWTATQLGVVASMGIIPSYRRNGKTFIKEQAVKELYIKLFGTNEA